MSAQLPIKNNRTPSNSSPIPQSQPLNREGQVEMRSGGYGFTVSDWSQLRSLLIMGSGGSYYEDGDHMLNRHSDILLGLISKNGVVVVQTAVELSQKGLTLKNTYSVYAIAMAAAFGTPETRKAALDALPIIVRTGSDLLFFVNAFCKLWGGWGRAIKRAINQWYTSRPLDHVVYQVLKYPNRHTWTHADVMRMSHLRSHIQKTMPNPAAWEVFLAWMRGEEGALAQAQHHPELRQLIGLARIQEATDDQAAAALVSEYRLTHEMIPNRWFDSTHIWSALLENMPYTAFIRTLNRITGVGMLHDLHARRHILARLDNTQEAIKGRVHPLNILLASIYYARGRRWGDVRWKPHPDVLKALDGLFHRLITSLERHKGRVLIAMDISGSMLQLVGEKKVQVTDVVAGMTLIAKHCYERVEVMGVDMRVHRHIPITSGMSLRKASFIIEKLSWGGTALNVLFDYLIEKYSAFDAVLFLTDSESWAGDEHVQVAWEKYRAQVAPNARLLYGIMVPNEYSLADPKDSSVCVTSGFDPNIFSILDMMLDGIL